jgi:hypothetical protein
MHGNESTTTKGLFDFLNLLNEVPELAEQLLRVLVLLNPNVKPRRGEIHAIKCKSD